MDAHEEDAASADLIVPLHSRRQRRRLIAQKLQHAIPTAGLLTAAFQSLNAGAHGFELALAIAEIVTSVKLLQMLAKSARETLAPRGKHTHHGHGVDWFDIWAAGMLFTEAAERWHLHHRIPAATLATAAVTLGIGLLHGRIAARNERRRSMRLTGDHLFIGGRNKFIRNFTAKWDDIDAITMTEREAVIRTKQGKKRRVNLADLENAADVREALHAAQRRLEAAAS
jgi:hypothetical protein